MQSLSPLLWQIYSSLPFYRQNNMITVLAQVYVLLSSLAILPASCPLDSFPWEPPVITHEQTAYKSI